MKSAQYHFKIIAPDGSVRYDSKKFRINAFSSEGMATKCGGLRLKNLSLNPDDYKVEAYLV